MPREQGLLMSGLRTSSHTSAHTSVSEDAVTHLLSEWRGGDEGALDRLTPLIYEELRRMAGYYLHLQAPGHTLQPTALVHEFYLKAAGLRNFEWQNRAQFIATAARVMRNLLVDHARKKKAGKRSGGAPMEPIEGIELPSFDPAFDLLDLDRALMRLGVEYPRHAQVVELVFFGGLSPVETARVLESEGKPVSPRTVERDWRFAKAWLLHELSPS